MNRLDHFRFSTKTGFNGVLLRLRYRELSRFFKGKSCLEFGAADGEGTRFLTKHFQRIVAVDGSVKQIGQLRKSVRSRKVEGVVSLFEKFNSEERFDTVLLAHILEHVADPVKTLRIARRHLKKGGVLLIDVPNALSIHRQVGVRMGMLKTEYHLNAADRSIGHRRVYDFDRLRRDVLKAGLRIKKEGGIFLKPFSNAQMEKLLNRSGIQAFSTVGKKYPELAAEIYLVCQ